MENFESQCFKVFELEAWTAIGVHKMCTSEHPGGQETSQQTF